MHSPNARTDAGEEVAVTRRYHDGPADAIGDVRVRGRFFTQETESGLIAGATWNVMFVIDRPVKDVWPVFKDFNAWQNSFGHYYSGVVGDLEGRTFALGTADDLGPPRYEVLKVIPEYLIVIRQPIPDDEGNGGISPGFHAFTLSEHAGSTTITATMEHSTRTSDLSETDALRRWQEFAPEWQQKWRDIFIPALRKLVDET